MDGDATIIGPKIWMNVQAIQVESSNLDIQRFLWQVEAIGQQFLPNAARFSRRFKALRSRDLGPSVHRSAL